MAVNRLRQKYATGIGDVKCSITEGNGNVTSWSNRVSNLGETKSIYDETTTQEFTRLTKLGSFTVSRVRTSPKRNAANFRPVRIASIIKGNSAFNGEAGMSFAVPGKFANVTVLGPIVALADLTQSSFTYLPPISTVFPTQNTQRGLYCLQQAANSASDAVHEFGVTLGELAETISMLTNPLRAISKLSKKMGLLDGSFRKDATLKKLLFSPSNRVRQFAKKTGMQKITSGAQSGRYIVDQSSNFWLTWRFGVKPLIKEISDIMLMDYSNYESSDIRIARKRAADDWTIRSGHNVGGLGYRLYYEFDDIVKFRSMSSASYAYSVKHGFGLSDFLNSTGLSLRHLPQVMWELVPCSFVLDRFVDVGSFIRSITPDPNVKTIDTCISEKVEIILDRRVTGGYYLYWPVTGLKFSRNNKLRVWNYRYSRDIGIPVPRLPQFNPKLLKIEQLIDHATLVFQRLPKWR